MRRITRGKHPTGTTHPLHAHLHRKPLEARP
jgi:hypothetical protein